MTSIKIFGENPRFIATLSKKATPRPPTLQKA